MSSRCCNKAKGKRKKEKSRQSHLYGVDCLALTMIDAMILLSSSASWHNGVPDSLGRSPDSVRSRSQSAGGAAGCQRRCGRLRFGWRHRFAGSLRDRTSGHYLYTHGRRRPAAGLPARPLYDRVDRERRDAGIGIIARPQPRHLSDGNHRLQFWLQSRGARPEPLDPAFVIDRRAGRLRQCHPQRLPNNRAPRASEPLVDGNRRRRPPLVE